MSGGDHGRRLGPVGLGGAAGAAAGVLGCWSVFASTALRQPGTLTELRLAALGQVAPDRASERRRQQVERLVRSAPFPVYGPARWHGPRSVTGHGSRGDVLSSVTLEHGELADAAGGWLRVETAVDEDLGDPGIEEMLAEDLWRLTWQPPPGTGDTAADHPVSVEARERALADRPAAQWEEGNLDVDGRQVPARRLVDGEHWTAHAAVDGVRVSVQARSVPPESVRLEVADLDTYASFG